MAEETQQTYGDGTDSTIGTQLRTDHYIKKALIETRKQQFFMPLSGTVNMPKHMGKMLKKYHYLPLLDDANINDQGIDAAGNALAMKVTFTFKPPEVAGATSGMNLVFIIGEGANAAAALTAAKLEVNLIDEIQNSGHTVVAWNTDWATTVADYQTAGWLVTDDANVENGPYVGAVPQSGNLYGSSKDPGTISSKMPSLSEVGGRVNRVGFKRKDIQGTFENFGFFDEYTQDSLDFDTDAELTMHVNREMLNGAVEMTEDALQIDLLNAAGVVRFPGTAMQTSDLDASVGMKLTYNDFLKLSIDLDNNRAPKQTQILTGTRMVDTKTISGGRVMYCGSELLPTLEEIADTHGDRAYIKAQHYAAGTTLLNGEEGAIGNFRIIVVPEMMKWEGAGADSTGSATHYETGGNFDVFPLLTISAGSFTNIGFQTDGKTVKFKIIHKKPGIEQAGHHDPYGKTGFMSIQWWYGFLLERPERIGLMKCTIKI